MKVLSWLRLPRLISSMIISAGLGLIFLTNPATAATNNYINFQARLLNASGSLVLDGNYNIEFKIYDANSSSGSSQGSCTGDTHCKWVETRTGANQVRVAGGYLSVQLGSVSAFGSINWDQQLYLTMNIGGTSGTPSWDGEMLNSGNRMPLTGVPFAFSSTNSFNLQNSGYTNLITGGSGSSISMPQASSSANALYFGGDTTADFYRSAASTITTDGNLIAVGSINTDTLGASALTFSGANPIISASTTNTGLNLQANGTGTLSLYTTGAGTVNLGTTNTTTIGIGSTSSSTTLRGTSTTVISNSATAFQVQDVTSGVSLFNVDENGGIITLGAQSLNGFTGNLKFKYSSFTSSGSTTLTIADPGTNNYTITLPAQTGTVCTTGSVCTGYAPSTGGSGYIQNQVASPQSANFNIISSAATNTNTIHANASQSVDIFDVNNSSSTVYFGVGSDGSLTSSPATAGTITLGTASETGNITIGQYNSTSTSTINIGAALASAGTQNINIGSGSAGINALTIGSNSSTSTTAIRGGTGASAIALSSGAGGGIALTSGNNGSGVAGNITLTTGTSSSGNASIIAKSSTNSNAAFQVQNAAGVNLFNVNTFANVITTTQSNLIVTDLATPTSPSVVFGANSGGNISGAAGITYYYKVTALNAVGESLGSSEVSISTASFTQISTPSAPTATKSGFDVGPTCGSSGCIYKITYMTANGETAASAASNAITSSTGNVILLSFTACNSIPGCSGINVYRSRSGGSYQLLTGTGCNGLAPSSTSCADDIATDSGIAVPSAFATTNLNTLTVSWTAVTGATSYRIYRGTSSNGESVYQTSASSPFADSSASGGTAGSVPTRSTVAQIGIGTSSPSANLDVEGTALFKNSANSTTAFQVQNASGTGVFNVDTTNGRVGIGTSAPSYKLHVLAGANTVGTYFDGTTTDTSFYIAHGSVTPPSTTAGIRVNGGAAVLNAKNGATIYFNRDIAAADVNFQYNSGNNSALFIQGSTGNVVVGTTAATSLYTGFTGQSPTILEVAGTTSTAGNDHYGNITVSANQTGTSNLAGNISFANNGLGSAEKRLAGISGWTDGATNSGKLNILTSNAGVPSTVATFDHLGNLTETGSITGVGVNSQSGQIQGTGGISVSGSATLAGTTGDTTTIGNTTGNINIGTSNASSATISLGGGTSTTSTINIGQATTTAGQNINIQNSLTTGTSTINVLSSAATGGSETFNLENGNITSTTQSVNIAGGTSTTSGGKTVNIANGTPGASTTNTVAIGTGGTTTGTVGITIGSNGAANHTLVLQGGNSNSVGSEAIRLQVADAGGIAIGTTTQTGTITIGKYNSTGTSTINIGAALASAGTQNINIGNGSAGINTVTIGSGSSSSGVTINSGSNGVLVKSGASNNSTTAFQVQNASSNQVLAVDTSNNQVVFGKASTVNGQLLFYNSFDGNGITISAPSTGVTSPYSLILPTAGAASFGQCIQTTGSSLSQLTFGACTATGLGKNVADTSSNGSLASNANLYTFSNTTANASGVLKLDNGTSTNSTLVVTASGNPTSSQALIFASNTNASPTGNLIDLQAGSGPTSMFSVSSAGVTSIGGATTSNIVSTGTNPLYLDTASSSASVRLQTNGGGNVVIHAGTNGTTSVSELILDNENSTGTAPTCNLGGIYYAGSTSGTNLKVDSANTTIGHIMGCVKGQGGTTVWEALDNYVDVFKKTSGSGTYFVPTGASVLTVIECGGGGGGGGGGTANGGGGGGGGAYRTATFNVADLGASSEAYAVGGGGGHGAAGANGSNGGYTTFGASGSLLRAGGGGGGINGSSTAKGGAGGSFGTGGTTNPFLSGSISSSTLGGVGVGGFGAYGGVPTSTTGGDGGFAETGGAGAGGGGPDTGINLQTPQGGNGGNTEFGGGGGGGGGGYNSNSLMQSGLPGGNGGDPSPSSVTAAGSGQSTSGGNGDAGNGGQCGGGAAGGGGGFGVNAQAGGTGAANGGGGGGGGNASGGSNAAGGDGGAGLLIVIAW